MRPHVDPEDRTADLEARVTELAWDVRALRDFDVARDVDTARRLEALEREVGWTTLGVVLLGVAFVVWGVADLFAPAGG